MCTLINYTLITNNRPFFLLFSRSSSNENNYFPSRILLLTAGNCTDDVYSYICKCEAGWTGKRCEIDIDECESSPCVNGNWSVFNRLLRVPLLLFLYIVIIPGRIHWSFLSWDISLLLNNNNRPLLRNDTKDILNFAVWTWPLNEKGTIKEEPRLKIKTSPLLLLKSWHSFR